MSHNNILQNQTPKTRIDILERIQTLKNIAQISKIAVSNVNTQNLSMQDLEYTFQNMENLLIILDDKFGDFMGGDIDLS